MEIFKEIEPLRTFLANKRKAEASVGLVPTMGALHEGHMALIRASKAENSLSIASVYINPTQFNNSADLDKYPRTLESDTKLLNNAGCDILFLPSNEVMYRGAQQLKFDFGQLDKVMEGKFRPGHFSGVALVVSKLLNIINPDKAYFGQKDYQQFQIIRSLVEELKFPLTLRSVPIVRAPSGLALSSRNQRLSASELVKATMLYESLRLAKDKLLGGDDFDKVKLLVESNFNKAEGLELEYFEIADRTTLQPLHDSSGLDQAILLIAAYVNGVRLIDNMLLVDNEG